MSKFREEYTRDTTTAKRVLRMRNIKVIPEESSVPSLLESSPRKCLPQSITR